MGLTPEELLEAQARAAKLSTLEAAALRGVQAGLRSKEIQRELALEAPTAVDNALKRACQKLGTPDRRVAARLLAQLDASSPGTKDWLDETLALVGVGAAELDREVVLETHDAAQPENGERKRPSHSPHLGGGGGRAPLLLPEPATAESGPPSSARSARDPGAPLPRDTANDPDHRPGRGDSGAAAHAPELSLTHQLRTIAVWTIASAAAVITGTGLTLTLLDLLQHVAVRHG